MKKIDLPINIEKSDNVLPWKPDLWWLFYMLLIIIPFLITCYLLFYWFAYIVVWNISLDTEKDLFWDIWLENNLTKFDLNILDNKIDNLFEYDVYLKDSSEINAYALLGWNIIITKGLLENIDYEEELIFILWHESEHIKNRDVLKSLLSDIPFSLSLHFLGFDFWLWLFDMTKITTNYFNKNIELNSDKWWIYLINKMNLNLNCSIIFFENDTKIFNTYLQFISTHPTNINRISKIRSKIKNTDKECTKINFNL